VEFCASAVLLTEGPCIVKCTEIQTMNKTVTIVKMIIMMIAVVVVVVKGKGKGLSQQTEVAQGVPGRLRPRIFLTFRHHKGGSSSAKGTDRLYPRRNTWYSLSEAESTSRHMVLSGVPRKKSQVTPPGIDPGTDRLVAQCLNNYATPDPSSSSSSSSSSNSNNNNNNNVGIVVILIITKALT